MNPLVPTTLQRVSAVATLPAIAMRIIRLADDPSSTSDDMLEVLSSDPALATRVLKVVNSAFYGRPRQVATTYAAIQLLGVSAIRNIAVAASLTRIYRGGRTVAGFDAASLWMHSVAVGAAARRLALLNGKCAPDEAMLAGLLHDVGVVVSLQAWLPGFTSLIASVNANHLLDFRDAERQIIGADHEQFGEGLCDQWHFPKPLALSCGYHHHPLDLPEGDRLLPSLVHVADILAARADIGFTRTVLNHEVIADVRELLGLTERDLESVEESLKEDSSQAMMLFAA